MRTEVRWQWHKARTLGAQIRSQEFSNMFSYRRKKYKEVKKNKSQS